MKNEKIAALIPVAGLSGRMGEFKPLLQLGGKTLIENSVQSVLSGGAETVVVVTGYRADEVEQVLAKAYGDRVRFVRNNEYEQSDMMYSVKLGVSALPPCDAFFLVPGDMPLISKSTFFKLLSEREYFSDGVLIPTTEGRQTHPPLIDAKMIPVILAFRGDGGLRHLWKQTSDRIRQVPVEDKGAEIDVDTPRDYQECKLVYHDIHHRKGE
ncbi:MAG: nucleotidyltransferase family protein [Acetatifactor sp.]|nr:nucleotidyltransferase family protein [Acetatifactor sp.]